MAWELDTGDLKFYYTSTNVPSIGTSDVRLEGKDLHRDPGLETAILISIFTDARADEGDKLPSGNNDKRGYWGSELLGFQIGSKLWLLERSKITNVTIALAQQYIADSLEWMITDGILKDVKVTVSRSSTMYHLNFLVEAVRGNDTSLSLKFFANWQYQTIGALL